MNSHRGLFITATDTEVGKTFVSCAIASYIQRYNPSIGILKPFASGCQNLNGKLINEDAVLLKLFSKCPLPLSQITPLTFEPPLAPAPAAALSGKRIDLASIESALSRVRQFDFTIVEGVGGLCVPLDPENPQWTVIDLISMVRYPVIVVARAGLGTINHTVLTLKELQRTGAKVAGFILNRSTCEDGSDISTQTNRQWIEAMSGIPCLAEIPYAPFPTLPDWPPFPPDQDVEQIMNQWIEEIWEQFEIPEIISDAMSGLDWYQLGQ